MRLATPNHFFLIIIVMGVSLLGHQRSAQADSSKYPQFAQQSLPAGITPSFINVEELFEAVLAGSKPLIFDVRTKEEFQEAHILSAQSAPLANFKQFAEHIPRDRLVILY